MVEVASIPGFTQLRPEVTIDCTGKIWQVGFIEMRNSLEATRP